MRRETRFKNWRKRIVWIAAILIGGGFAFLLGVGQTASPAQPPPTILTDQRPDNSWELHWIGSRGRRLSRIYDTAYSPGEVLRRFHAEYGPREVICVARRSFAQCDIIERPPGK